MEFQGNPTACFFFEEKVGVERFVVDYHAHKTGYAAAGQEARVS